MQAQDKNGWTKNGKVAGDYRLLSLDPNRPRLTPQETERRLKRLLKRGA